MLFSLGNLVFGDNHLDIDVVGFLIGTVLYSFFAYSFTLVFSVPCYLLVKKLNKGKQVNIVQVTVWGYLIGFFVYYAFTTYMSGKPSSINLAYSISWGVMGIVLSIIFWFITLRKANKQIISS